MDELAKPLADAIGAALDAAAARMEEPALAVVYFGAGGHYPGLPPSGCVIDGARIEAARGISREPDDVLHLAQLDGPGECVQLDIAGHLDPAVLETCRQLVQQAQDANAAAQKEIRQLIEEHGKQRAWELETGFKAMKERTAELQALRLEVARRVDTTPGRPPTVWLPDIDGEGTIAPWSDPQGQLRRTARWQVTLDAAGPERVEALQSLIGSPAGTARRAGWDTDDKEADEITAARTRDELRAVALDAGFDAATSDRIAAAAQIGLALHERQADEPGRCRLGGTPELPPGEPWPETDGQPLAFLGTLALDELPDADQRELLPTTGRLLFFANLEDIELPPRVLHVPDDAPAEPREPPPETERIDGFDVKPVPVLTAPYAYTLGLAGMDAHRYDAVEHAAEAARRDPAHDFDGWVGAHQVLGHPQLVQFDDPREGDQVLLLQVSSDHRLRYTHGDGGTIYFLATPDALRAQRWGDVTTSDQMG
jgi:hypothetical protein